MSWLAVLFLYLPLSSVLALLLYTLFVHKVPPRRCGVYSRPSALFPLKFRLIRRLVALQKWQKQRGAGLSHADLFRLTAKDRTKRVPVEVLERKHKVPDDLPMAGDCVFFNGSDSNGNYMALGFAQRPNNIANVFFVLRIDGVGTFVNEDLLRTPNVKTIPSDTDYKSESGFRISCRRPMESWKVEFDGYVVESRFIKQNLTKVGAEEYPEHYEKVHCKFELDWLAIGDPFDFDADISADLIGACLAREPWSGALFRTLQAKHQRHYEQFGRLSGPIQLQEGPGRRLQLVSMRDHSVAPYRNWAEIRRYAMLMFHLADGRCVNTSAISMPEQVWTELHFGYVVNRDGTKSAVDQLHLHLADLGESDRRVPDRFHYTFHVADGPAPLHRVVVQVRERVAFKMGLAAANYIEEMLCDFEMDGVRGWGFCELAFRIHPY